MKQRIFSLFTALCLCFTLLPTAAFAEGSTPGTTGVNYLYYDESTEEMATGAKADTEYTIVENSNSAVTWGNSTSDTWYVVPKDTTVTISGTVTLNGNVHLILCDGADLTVIGGITDDDTIGRNLTIYGQSESGDVGKLTASTDGKDAGIFVRDNTLTINGGVVNAEEKSEDSGYGIYAETLNIHGGSVSGTGKNLGIWSNFLTTTGGTVSGYSTSEVDIGGYTLYISGGKFNGNVVAYTNLGKTITGGTFNQKLTVSGEDLLTDPDYHIADLLADGYICQSTVDITDGKDKDEYYTLNELANVKTLSSVRVVKCPHTGLNAKGECSYCLKAFVASLTSDENIA